MQRNVKDVRGIQKGDSCAFVRLGQRLQKFLFGLSFDSLVPLIALTTLTS
jgi:hypothetical protein